MLEQARPLLRDAVAYSAAASPGMPDYLREALIDAVILDSAIHRLTEICEVLYAAREELGETGRVIVRRIAIWGDTLGQQRLAGGRGQLMAEAMLRDIKTRDVAREPQDPEIDPRFAAPIEDDPAVKDHIEVVG